MTYLWIREDKEEFFTGDYDAEGKPIYDIPANEIEMNSYSELAEVEELINPITIQPLAYGLHSQLASDFYLKLCGVLEAELQLLMNDSLRLSNIYSTDLFLGSETEFKARVTNVTTLLGFKLPLFFSNSLGASSGENLLVDRIKWYQELLKSVYILRQWSGSSLGYKTLFKLVKKQGSLFLRAQYKLSTFEEQTDKFFRVINAENFSNNLVESVNYPNSYGISGEEDYSNTKLRVIQFDTRLVFDKSGLDGDPSLFDSEAQIAGESTKGLSLEVNLDEILKLENSIQTTKCLMDLDWLRALSVLLGSVKKASDKVSVGCQLSLTALGNGRKSKYAQDEPEKYLYTHPNIEASFQVIPNKFSLQSQLSYIKVGSGNHGNAVFNPSDSINFDILLKEYPTDVQKPVFQTSLGYNEQGILGKYKVANTMIHSQTFFDQPASFNVTLNKELTPLKLESLIDLPHSAITPGSLSMTLRVSSPTLNLYDDRYIYITQAYNETKDIYDPKTLIKKPTLVLTGQGLVDATLEMLSENPGMPWDKIIEKIKITYSLNAKTASLLKIIAQDEVEFGGNTQSKLDEIVYVSLVEVTDKSYNIFVDDLSFFGPPSTTSFLQGDADTFFLLMAIPGKLDSYGLPVYTDINLINGSLSLKLIYNIQNTIGSQYGEDQDDTDPYLISGKVSYEINALRGSSSSSTKDVGKAVITEMGVFDVNDEMVAYASFPPIIYDSTKYHLSMNLALDTTPLVETDIPESSTSRQILHWSFDSFPEIPDDLTLSPYIQSTWASTDSWEAGLGTGAVERSLATTALLAEGTGSYHYHQIYRDSTYAAATSRVLVKLKNNSYISKVKVLEGASFKEMHFYRDGNYILCSYSMTENISSRLTINIEYTDSEKARSNITEITWIYVGEGTYITEVEDESFAHGNPGAAILPSVITGIKNKSLAFFEPRSYVKIQ